MGCLPRGAHHSPQVGGRGDRQRAAAPELAAGIARVKSAKSARSQLRLAQPAGERSPEKAGVGGSIPSLATIESIT